MQRPSNNDGRIAHSRFRPMLVTRADQTRHSALRDCQRVGRFRPQARRAHVGRCRVGQGVLCVTADQSEKLADYLWSPREAPAKIEPGFLATRQQLALRPSSRVACRQRPLRILKRMQVESAAAQTSPPFAGCRIAGNAIGFRAVTTGTPGRACTPAFPNPTPYDRCTPD